MTTYRKYHPVHNLQIFQASSSARRCHNISKMSCWFAGKISEIQTHNWPSVLCCQGLKPYSVYKAQGCSILRSLGQSIGAYVHHLTLSSTQHMAYVILVTSSHITSLLKHTATTQTRIQWTVTTSSVINLPVLEDDNLIIHCDKVAHSSKTLSLFISYLYLQSCPSIVSNPVIISSKNIEKLRSLQLAIEYALLLNMPYSTVANVHFNSVPHVESQ